MFDFAGSAGDLREATVSVQDRGVRLRADGCSIIVTFRGIRFFGGVGGGSGTLQQDRLLVRKHSHARLHVLTQRCTV